MPDALPRAAIGYHLISLTSWLHDGLGVTIDQMIEILSCHLQTRLTPGGLIDAWRRLSEIFPAWYEQIVQEPKKSAYLHADAEGDREESLKAGGSMAGDVGCGVSPTIAIVMT